MGTHKSDFRYSVVCGTTKMTRCGYKELDGEEVSRVWPSQVLVWHSYINDVTFWPIWGWRSPGVVTTVVRIGTPQPPLPAGNCVPPPPFVPGGGAHSPLARGRGGGDPIRTGILIDERKLLLSRVLYGTVINLLLGVCIVWTPVDRD
jgi:hypothetical protein